jgi:hypothetical protein
MGDQNIKYTPEDILHSECFNNLYLYSLMDTIPNLNIESNDRKINDTSVGWTLGAAVCETNNCLDKSMLNCHWKEDNECSL